MNKRSSIYDNISIKDDEVLKIFLKRKTYNPGVRMLYDDEKYSMHAMRSGINAVKYHYSNYK